MEKIKEFLVNDEDQIKLLLYAISENIDLKYLNLHEDTEADIKLLDMSGVISMDYDLRRYVITGKDIGCEIREGVDEYRAIFSVDEKGTRGLKIGSLGDRTSCIRNLEKWFKENPEYTMNEVINAARYYVDDISKSRNYQYLVRSHYFIYKNKESLLSSLIEEGKDYERTGSTDLNSFNVII